MTTCAEIRALLPDYASRRLDEKTGAAVEAHCARCAACAAERDWFRLYYRELQALGEAKAPDDFLIHVRARLARRTPLARIIQGLFVPVRMKIPLELAGVAATVVMLVAVFHLVRPAAVVEYRVHVPAQEATSALKTAWKEPPPREAPAARPATAHARAPYRPAHEMEGIAADRLQVGQEERGESVVAEQEVNAVPPLAPPLAKAEERDKGRVIEISLLVSPRELKHELAYESGATLGSAAMPEMKAKRDSRVYRRTAAKKKSLAKEEATETAAAGEPSDRVKTCVESAGGKIILTDRDKVTGRPAAMVAEVPARAYPGLVTALARMGEIRGTPQPVLPGAGETVRVRILLLPSR